MHHSDVLDRKLQAEKSAEILSTTPDPVVMLSYITNPPGSRDYLKIVNSGRVKVSTLSLLIPSGELSMNDKSWIISITVW